MTIKVKILVSILIILVIGISIGGIYIYPKYQKTQKILYQKKVDIVDQETLGEFGAEEYYEEYVGDRLFRNKGVAVIEETEYGYTLRIFTEEGIAWVLKTKSTNRVLDSTGQLSKYLGKFVTLTYQKEHDLEGYYTVMCLVAPCPPEARYGPTRFAIKEIKEVTLSERQKEQLAIALKGGVDAWATYTDDVHGFSIKYPGHYYAGENRDGLGVVLGNKINIRINDGGKYFREQIGNDPYIQYEAIVADQGVKLGKRIGGTLNRWYKVVAEFDHAGDHYFVAGLVDYAAPERDEGFFKSIVETVRFMK